MQTAFRAENALSRKHLCEFAMLEAELAAEDLNDLVGLTEDLIKHCWREVRVLDEFKVLKAESWRDTVDEALEQSFLKLSYDDAVKELEGRVGHFASERIVTHESMNRNNEEYLEKLAALYSRQTI